MRRYLEIEKQVYQELEKNCYGNKKRNGYRHLFGVSQLCLLYSMKFQLNQELCAIIGLLHDYSIYKKNTSFNHALLSSELAKKMLEESLLFDHQEIDIIVESIKNHSDKSQRHDSYCELLKMCDVVETYIYEPEMVFDKHKEYYLKKWREINE